MAHYPDGEYTFEQLKDSFGKEFQSEKELCNFIEEHIKDFCSDFLEVQYKSHKREHQIIKCRRNAIKGNRRIDFLVQTQDEKWIVIECKHPKVLCELPNSLGQCLSYKTLLSQAGIKTHRVILISTKIDHLVTQVITDYQLPIEYMVMDKSKCVKFSHHVSR